MLNGSRRLSRPLMRGSANSAHVAAIERGDWPAIMHIVSLRIPIMIEPLVSVVALAVIDVLSMPEHLESGSVDDRIIAHRIRSLASFAALTRRLRRRILRDIAMLLDKLQQIKSTENTNHLFLMGDNNVMNLVVAHDSRRDADVLVLWHNVYFFRHDGADRRAELEVVCEIGGRDHAHWLTITIDDRDRADVVPVQELADMFDSLMWLRGQY